MRPRLLALHVASCACVWVAPAAMAQTSAPKPAPQCSAARLVGTWERVSLLRNALSVQPPDAPMRGMKFESVLRKLKALETTTK